MKRKFNTCMFLLLCMFSSNLSATYYIAGNGADDPNGKWCNNSNWCFQELNGGNTITFYGVAAGKNYGFKVKDSNSWETGTEYTTFDYDNSDQPLYGGNGGDMGFTLTETADVTISVGVSGLKPRDTLTAAVERADSGLYKVKEAGRNKVFLVK